MTTTRELKPGDQVCRKMGRAKVVGTVLSVGEFRATVKWHQSQGWCCVSQRSCIYISSLIHADDFVPRKLSGPEEKDWSASCFVVKHDDGTQPIQYGVNCWRFGGNEQDAAFAKFHELLGENKVATLLRQDVATWVPQGCRSERTKYRWWKWTEGGWTKI